MATELEKDEQAISPAEARKLQEENRRLKKEVEERTPPLEKLLKAGKAWRVITPQANYNGRTLRRRFVNGECIVDDRDIARAMAADFHYLVEPAFKDIPDPRQQCRMCGLEPENPRHNPDPDIGSHAFAAYFPTERYYVQSTVVHDGTKA